MVYSQSRRYFWIVISVAFASFMARLNNYTVNISLPTMAQFFGVSTGEVSRIVMSYLLIITSTLLLFGRLGDRIGLKRIFITGYIIFVMGSFLCGLSHNIHVLVGLRCIQGVGAAMLLATSFAIISKCIPADRLGWAFGITSTSSALGVATGAPVGGLITGYLSWHWIFFVNIPVWIAAIIVAVRMIPSDSPAKSPDAQKGQKESFDIPGAIFSFVGLVALLYAMNRGRELGWASPFIVLTFAVAVVFLTAFIIREKRCSAPLLKLSFFWNPVFTFALLATFAAFMLIAGNAFLLPFYLQIVKGLSVTQTGMVLLTYSLIYVFLSSPAGRLADKVNPTSLCTIATISAAACTFTFSLTLPLPGLVPAFVFLIWLGLSYVIFFSPNNKQIMSLAPPGSQGSASGLFNTVTNLAMVFGVGAFEMIFSASTTVLTKDVKASAAMLPGEMLTGGFQNAYIFGGILCVAGAVFSLLTRKGR
jgi:EmrB/QacA subfamily drug resistance transporter